MDTVTLIERLATHRREFVAFAHARLPGDVDPEDVVQQALERATRKVSTLEDPDRLLAWFYTLLRRAISDALARRGRHHDQLATLERVTDREARVPPADPFDTLGVCKCGTRLLEDLPESWRSAIWRVDVEGDSPAEVARDLGTTANNVRVRTHRARARLREEITACCDVSTVEECLACEC